MVSLLHSYAQRLQLFFRNAGWSLLTLLVGVLLPLVGVVTIATDVAQKDPFSFEKPLMLAVHAQAAPPLDRLAASLTAFGNTPGMLPVTLILAVCFYRLRPRLTYFLLVCLAGSVLFHAVLKDVFDRPRPTFWPPLVPEADFSFPSGHAMFATTLVAALAVMLWPTRWRAATVLLGTAYVLSMMWARVYSGVHYPTDVLAGALVGLAWVMALNWFLKGHRWLSPQQ
ncbi:MAG: putative superfamily rane-associated lipid phosphatase [Deinococcus sp.]|nr:putative superfamily rane-associated lipid phosphatase [Deinococcus sp.]